MADIETHVKTAAEKVQKLNQNKEKTTPQEIAEATAAVANIAKEKIKDAASTSRTFLKTELQLLPDTLRALPNAVQETSAGHIDELKKHSSGLWENIKGGGESALNFATSTASMVMEKSGLNTMLTKVGDMAGKVGEWTNAIWDQLKPHLAKLAAIPSIAFLIGKDNLQHLQEWLGYDSDTLAVEEAFKSRLGKNVVLNITIKKEMQLFKDARMNMLKKNGKKPNEYSYDSFVQELMSTTELMPFTNDAAAAKELPMATILSAAKKLNEKTPQATPPASTPPAK